MIPMRLDFNWKNNQRESILASDLPMSMSRHEYN